MNLTDKEEKLVRKLVHSVGITEAARILEIHRSSLLTILSGSQIKPNTAAVMRANLVKVKA
jgi:hypothetical protein